MEQRSSDPVTGAHDGMSAATTSSFRIRCAAGEDTSVAARLYQAGGPAPVWLALGHGAGAGHDSAFMVSYARALAALGIPTVTFNFPYIERGRRVPDPAAVLESCWKAVVVAVRERAGARTLLVAGGKSMGGRIASQVAADGAVAKDLAGLLCLGYPLYPPGRPERPRTAHWPNLRLPALFVQGSRDPFASPDELRAALSAFGGAPTVVIVDGGDHSFKVPRASGTPQAAVHAAIQSAVAEWVAGLRARSASSERASAVRGQK